MSTKHQKDMLDIEVLKDKIDHSKIKEMSKYHTTLKIVKPKEIIQEDHSLLDSAIEATEESTRKGAINEQAQIVQAMAGYLTYNLAEKNEKIKFDYTDSNAYQNSHNTEDELEL